MEKINVAFDPIHWDGMTRWGRKRMTYEIRAQVLLCRQVASDDAARQHPAIPRGIYRAYPQQRANDLPTALLAGATKAEAAATRRAKRKKERILIVLLVLGVVCLLWLTCFFMGKGR